MNYSVFQRSTFVFTSSTFVGFAVAVVTVLFLFFLLLLDFASFTIILLTDLFPSEAGIFMKFDHVIRFLVDGKRSKALSNLHLINDGSWHHSYKKRKFLPVSSGYDAQLDYQLIDDGYLTTLKLEKNIISFSFLTFSSLMSSHNTIAYCLHGAMWCRDAIIKQYQRLIRF